MDTGGGGGVVGMRTRGPTLSSQRSEKGEWSLSKIDITLNFSWFPRSLRLLSHEIETPKTVEEESAAGCF